MQSLNGNTATYEVKTVGTDDSGNSAGDVPAVCKTKDSEQQSENSGQTCNALPLPPKKYSRLSRISLKKSLKKPINIEAVISGRERYELAALPTKKGMESPSGSTDDGMAGSRRRSDAVLIDIMENKILREFTETPPEPCPPSPPPEIPSRVRFVDAKSSPPKKKVQFQQPSVEPLCDAANSERR